MIKTSIRFFSILSLGVLLISASLKVQAQEEVVSYQTFYDQLSPYGQWVSDAQYGDVWVPNEAAGYRPYATNGHWAMTDYGNMWVSDAPYGWATYHYGRWTYNPYYGWVWIPGHEWAPAWVSWRSGGGYYGWAPMGPGYEAGGSYAYPDNYWVFVGPGYLYQPNVYSYYDANRNFYYCQHTAYIHETYEGQGVRYNYGPRREAIEKETHQPVQVYRISNARNPDETRVSGNSVNVYRPAFNPESQRTARPANVIRATQPVGKPQEIARGQENSQPAFRQEAQRQNETRNQNNNAGSFGRGQQQSPSADRQNFNNQSANRPQPQHFQQQNTQTEQSQPSNNGQRQFSNNSQQQHYQQPMNRTQAAPNQQQFRQQGGNNQQQMTRPQPMQQPQQQQNRSQPQPQRQQQAPQRGEANHR